MNVETISEGYIVRRDKGHPRPQAGCPRWVVTDAGVLLCSFVTSAGLGVNDFLPVIATSCDNGDTWSELQPIWPELRGRYAILANISRSGDDDLFLFGSRTPIDTPGETNWSDETSGLKANELIWSRSTDDGASWASPAVIPMPFPCAAEAPGPMLITAHGRWIAPYAPYNTFGPDLRVERNQVVVGLQP